MFNYSLNSFFDRTDKEKFQFQVNKLLAECIEKKGTISFKINTEGDLNVYVSKVFSSDRELYVEGITPFLMTDKSSKSLQGNVLLPFIYDCSLISIPHNRIYSYGRNDFCMGEFFIRNLCTNLILKSPIRFKVDTKLDWGGSLWKKIIQVYYWNISRYFFCEMSTQPSKELIFSNCIMPTFDTNNSRFDNDAQFVRHLFQNSLSEIKSDDLIQELINCRNNVIEACYS